MKLLIAFVLSFTLSSLALARDLVVVLSPYQSPARAEAQVKTALQFLCDLPPSSTATIMDGERLKTIARFTVPENPAYRSAKARIKLNAGAVRNLMTFARASHTATYGAPPRVEQALNLPDVVREIAHNHTSDAPLDVIVLGSPLYDDPREPSLSFANGLYPSDGHLQASRASTPFGIESATAFKHIRLHIGYPDETIFLNTQHQYFIQRFWSLFLSRQGGALVTFTSNIPALFERVKAGSPAPEQSFKLEKTDKLNMNRLRRAEIGGSINDRPLSQSALPPQLFRRAASVEISITWDCMDCDIDLYARPWKGAQLLCYKQNRTPQGIHVKDFMTSPSVQNGFETIVFTVPVDVDALGIVLNFYKGPAPNGVHGTLRLSVNGYVFARPFHFPAGDGNNGVGVKEAFDTGKAPNGDVIIIDPVRVVSMR